MAPRPCAAPCSTHVSHISRLATPNLYKPGHVCACHPPVTRSPSAFSASNRPLHFECLEDSTSAQLVPLKSLHAPSSSSFMFQDCIDPLILRSSTHSMVGSASHTTCHGECRVLEWGCFWSKQPKTPYCSWKILKRKIYISLKIYIFPKMYFGSNSEAAEEDTPYIVPVPTWRTTSAGCYSQNRGCQAAPFGLWPKMLKKIGAIMTTDFLI